MSALDMPNLEAWAINYDVRLHSDVNRKHWAKSGIVAFDDKDSANQFYSAAVAKHHRDCITTWKIERAQDPLYIISLIHRYAEALERSKPLTERLVESAPVCNIAWSSHEGR